MTVKMVVPTAGKRVATGKGKWGMVLESGETG
jgi:hypothetical protein